MIPAPLSPLPPRRAVSPRVTFAARKGGAFYPGELERARSAPALPPRAQTGALLVGVVLCALIVCGGWW